MADAAEGQGAIFGCHLLGQFGGTPVDISTGKVLARLVAPVDELVVGGVEGEGLHHVGAGAKELTVQAQNF